MSLPKVSKHILSANEGTLDDGWNRITNRDGSVFVTTNKGLINGPFEFKHITGNTTTITNGNINNHNKIICNN